MEENQLILVITAIVFFPYILWNIASVLKSVIVDKIHGTKNQGRLSLQDTQKTQEISQTKRTHFENTLTLRQVKRLLIKPDDILPKNLRICLLTYQLELMQSFWTLPLTLSVVLFCKPCYAVLIGSFMYLFFVMTLKKAPRPLYNTVSFLPLVFLLIFYICFQFVPDSFMATEDFVLITKAYICVCGFVCSFITWYTYKKYTSMTEEEYKEIQKILQKIESGEI